MNGSIKLYLAVLVFMTAVSATAQRIIQEYDSVSIRKTLSDGTGYNFENPFFHEIRIYSQYPQSTTLPPKKVGRDIGLGLLTLVSGISIETADDAIFIAENSLVASDPYFSWQTHFFYSGAFEKSRERVRDGDGYSLETQKYIVIDWEKGAEGVIIEAGDTVGEFWITVKPGPIDDEWLRIIETECKSVHPRFPKGFLYSLKRQNFMVFGQLREKDFIIISSERVYRSLIFIEETPIAVFQDSPPFHVRKKKQIAPYLLATQDGIDIEMADLLRLSMLNCLIAKSVREL
jgi:hypothetical protein